MTALSKDGTRAMVGAATMVLATGAAKRVVAAGEAKRVVAAGAITPAWATATRARTATKAWNFNENKKSVLLHLRKLPLQISIQKIYLHFE